MKLTSILIVILFFLSSCTNQKVFNEIIIDGQVKNMPDGIIYLAEAHSWQVHLDSTISTDGHIQFRIKTDSSFVPYMASISYPDSTSPIKTSLLLFSNNFLLPPDTTKFYNYYNSAFYLKKGKTIINNQERLKQKFRGGEIPVTIKAGKETEIMYRNQFTDFGWIGNIDSLKRFRRIAFFKNEIRKHRFSYFLLQNIYEAKEQYSEKEITEI